MRNIRFWGRNCLESVGISALAALVLMFFFGISSQEFKAGGFKNLLRSELELYPYYLLMAGLFVVMMVTTAYFQIYFSILMSMNVTRKAVMSGIWVSNLALVVLLTGLSGIIWSAVPGDAADSGKSLLPLLAGALLIMGALVLLLGVAVMKWGKWGIIILGGIGALIGGACGMAAVLTKDIHAMLRSLSGREFHFYPVFAAGLVGYVLAGIFMAASMRKIEARL